VSPWRNFNEITWTTLIFGVARLLHTRSGIYLSKDLSMLATQSEYQLLNSRNKTVAKSFYRQLRTEGFSHEQIIELSATLLDLVTQDIKRPQHAH
jgi:hypothetical protein